MKTKKVRLISIITISIIFLLFYVLVWNGYEKYVWLHIVVDGRSVEDVRLIEQKLPLGEEPTLQDEEYTDFCISWQESYVDESWGLFLPDYIDLTNVYVMVSDKGGGETVTFDGISLQEDEAYFLGDLEEGAHFLSAGTKSQKLYVMKGSPIPSVWIDTEDGMSFVHEEQNNVTSGTVQIISAKGDLEYFGKMESLKGRGNSSWGTIKKGYVMKLATAAPLLNMTSGKSWTLIGGGFDDTGIRNKLFYDMAVECGLDNAIECEWVNLYVDGSYLGCYLLTEKITIGSGRLEIGDLEQRTQLENEQPLWEYPYYQYEENGKQWTGFSVPSQPADMSGGYLLEIEDYKNRFMSETSRFTTDRECRVVLKSPECATLEQVQYISSFVQEFEDALYSSDGYNSEGKYYLEYIDMESFVKRYLIDEISKNLDAGYSSYFFYKPQNDDKMYAGPVWDYDTSLGNNGTWGDDEALKDPEGMYVNTANWSKLLWEKEDFRKASYKVYQKVFEPYLEELLEYGLDEYAETIRDSAAMDRVYCGGEDWETEVEKMRDFLLKRRDYLSEEFR